MTNAELITTIRNEIERRKKEIHATVFNDEFDSLLSFLSTLESEKEQPDFPTTNEQVKEFLATHPKVEVPQKYKTPDWIFEKSENPIIPDGLDEEVHRFFEECIEVHEVPLHGKVKEGVITVDCYEITARHFAKWGAEHSGSSEIPNDLEEAAENAYPSKSQKFISAFGTFEFDKHKPERDAFIAGAKWQKEQDLAEMAQSKSPLSVAYTNRCFENGKQAMKEQIMKKAVEATAEICKLADRAWITPTDTKKFGQDVYDHFKAGDKVRIIILPKED